MYKKTWQLLNQQELYKAPVKGHRSEGFNKGYIGNNTRNIQLTSEIYNSHEKY